MPNSNIWKWEWVQRAIAWASAAYTAVAAVFSPWALTYIWAPALTAFSYLQGLREGVPTPYLMAACAAFLAFAMWFIDKLSILRARYRVQSKLRFMEVRGATLNAHDDNGELVIPTVQYSIIIDNKADFPIYFQFLKFVSDFDSRNHAGNGPTTAGVCMVDRHSQLGGTEIQCSPPVRIQAGTRKSGEVQFELMYGHEGRLAHKIRHRIKVHLTYRPDKIVGAAILNWEYADGPGDDPSD